MTPQRAIALLGPGLEMRGVSRSDMFGGAWRVVPAGETDDVYLTSSAFAAAHWIAQYRRLSVAGK